VERDRQRAKGVGFELHDVDLYLLHHSKQINRSLGVENRAFMNTTGQLAVEYEVEETGKKSAPSGVEGALTCLCGNVGNYLDQVVFGVHFLRPYCPRGTGGALF
jgi:hypothetical protein